MLSFQAYDKRHGKGKHALCYRYMPVINCRSGRDDCPIKEELEKPEVQASEQLNRFPPSMGKNPSQ